MPLDRHVELPTPLFPALAAVDRPIGEARGLPASLYIGPESLGLERQRVFGRGWTAIGFASEAAVPGATRAVDWLGEPLLMVRDGAGELRVFHNVCSHRGHRLVNGSCQSQGRLRCPYHAWTYGLDGQLRGTPHIGGTGVHEVVGFDRGRHGLRQVRSHVWLDLVFVNLDGGAPAFEDWIAPLLVRWEPFWGERGWEELTPAVAEEQQLRVAANWKLAVENYCEAYHLPFVHPALNRVSRLEDHYTIQDDAGFAGQGSLAVNLEENGLLPRFSHWPAARLNQAEYLALFPNLLVGLQADQFFVLLLEPEGEASTLERMRLYYPGEAARDPALAGVREHLTGFWRNVFMEDVGAVEGMQQGRHSSSFDGGVFSPVLDAPTHHFHRWMARRLMV